MTNFPWTLQKYILREMGKTFVMATIALTAVFSLGGGLLQITRLGQVSTGQLLQLMGLVIPMVAILTLPIAALFCATATYGRLSADNEFVACRSSGINMHVLLLPPLLLSLLTAGITFCFSNFLVPQMIKNLDTFVLRDTSALIRQRLDQPRGLKLPGNYRIYVEDDVVDDSHPNRVILRNVAFTELQGDDWKSIGTIRELVLDFAQEDGRTSISGAPRGLIHFDLKRKRLIDAAQQPFQLDELPLLLPRKIKFLDLPRLLYYLEHPEEWGPAKDAVEHLRGQLAARHVLDKMMDDFAADSKIEIRTAGLPRLSITAARAVQADGQGRIELHDCLIKEYGAGTVREMKARLALIAIGADPDADARDPLLDRLRIEVSAEDVLRIGKADATVQSKQNFERIGLPGDEAAAFAAMTDEQLFAAAVQEAADDPDLATSREKAIGERGDTHRTIVATINERLAVSCSVFVLVVFGAAVATIARGAHVLIAFGISFVPSAFVLVTILMGKQTAENANTHFEGLAVMWSGMVLVGLLNLFTLTKVLRR